MKKTLPVTEVRKKLTNLVDEVNGKFEQIVITKNGRPRALLMSVDEFDSWQETLEILSDKNLMREIKQAEKEYKEGKTTTLEEFKQELNL